MTTTTCPRCNDLGMAQHKHISGGVCFVCGRLPGGEKASAALLSTARERSIGWFRGTLAATADGRCDARGEDRAEIAARLAAAPADVAVRARAAFARLGVAV